jgi:hypothetical protein
MHIWVSPRGRCKMGSFFAYPVGGCFLPKNTLLSMHFGFVLRYAYPVGVSVRRARGGGRRMWMRGTGAWGGCYCIFSGPNPK